MTDPINGSDLMLFKDNKSFALATSCKLSLNVETVETSSKDTGGKWATKKAHKISWSVFTENLFASETAEGHIFDDLFKIVTGNNEFDVVFTTKNEPGDVVPGSGWTPKPNTGYGGKVVITSLEANAPNGENATYSATFEGSGPLKEVRGA